MRERLYYGPTTLQSRVRLSDLCGLNPFEGLGLFCRERVNLASASEGKETQTAILHLGPRPTFFNTQLI